MAANHTRLWKQRDEDEGQKRMTIGETNMEKIDLNIQKILITKAQHTVHYFKWDTQFTQKNPVIIYSHSCHSEPKAVHYFAEHKNILYVAHFHTMKANLSV